jgi:hypothetical protein
MLYGSNNTSNLDDLMFAQISSGTATFYCFKMDQSMTGYVKYDESGNISTQVAIYDSKGTTALTTTPLKTTTSVPVSFTSGNDNLAYSSITGW